MKCPKCGNNNTGVTYTFKGDIIRRRRRCNDCDYRFTTLEKYWGECMDDSRIHRTDNNISPDETD